MLRKKPQKNQSFEVPQERRMEMKEWLIRNKFYIRWELGVPTRLGWKNGGFGAPPTRARNVFGHGTWATKLFEHQGSSGKGSVTDGQKWGSGEGGGDNFDKRAVRLMKRKCLINDAGKGGECGWDFFLVLWLLKEKSQKKKKKKMTPLKSMGKKKRL